MPLVFAAIAPHGFPLIPDLSDDADGAMATRAAMEEIGRRAAAAEIESIVIAGPHGVRVDGAICLADTARAAGALAWQGAASRTECSGRRSADRCYRGKGQGAGNPDCSSRIRREPTGPECAAARLGAFSPRSGFSGTTEHARSRGCARRSARGGYRTTGGHRYTIAQPTPRDTRRFRTRGRRGSRLSRAASGSLLLRLGVMRMPPTVRTASIKNRPRSMPKSWRRCKPTT